MAGNILLDAASLASKLLGNAIKAGATKPVTVGVTVKDGKVGVDVSSLLADVKVGATKDSAVVLVDNILGSPELGGVSLGVVPGIVDLDVKWLTGDAKVTVVGKDVSVSVVDNLLNTLVQGLATPLAPVLSAAETALSGLGTLSTLAATLALPSN